MRTRGQGKHALQLPDEVVGPRVEPAGNVEADGDVEVTVAFPGESGQALAPQAEDLTSGGAGRDDQRRLSERGGNPDAGAAQRFPHADRNLAVDALAFPGEEGMRLDARAHDEIAAGPAERPRASFARQTDLGAVVDARRDRDRHGLDRSSDATPRTRPAGPSLGQPGGATPRTRREPRHRNVQRRAPGGIGKRQLDRGVDVVPATSGRQALGLNGDSEPVVSRPRPRVVQDAVRLRDLLEQRLGASIPEVDVGRVLPREAPVGLPDLARSRRGRDAEHRVVVTTHGHFFSPRSSNSASTTSPSLAPPGGVVPLAPRPAPPAPAWPWLWSSRYMISASLCEACVSVSWARFMRSKSSVLRASRASSSASSTALRSASASLLPCSDSVRSVEYTSESVWFRTSISCLRLVSSAALDSASFTMRSISSLVRPDDAVMVMFCCLAVGVSLAETLGLGLAYMSVVVELSSM